MPPKEKKTKMPMVYNVRNTSGAILSVPKTERTEFYMKRLFTPQDVQEQPKKVVVPRGSGMERRRAVSEPPTPSYKKGGKVAKTGMALVHRGEVVVPASRVASVDKALKKAGMKPLKK